MPNKLSTLGLFRAGPLTTPEFAEAMLRHGVPEPEAIGALDELIGQDLVAEVGYDNGADGKETVRGLSDRGRTALSDAVATALRDVSDDAVAATGLAVLLGRPEANRRDHDGEPVAMAGGNRDLLDVYPDLWPPYDLPQYTPTESLRERRHASWWPWTVPDPCGCLWARSPGVPWQVVPLPGSTACAEPPDALSPGAEPSPTLLAGPLVTAVMPTADRPHFVERSIGYFLDQTYPVKELIIVDDGAQPVDHLVPADGRVRYLRLDQRHTIGAKVNAGVQAAGGEIIAQWDDDDWHGPERIATQVVPILRDGASITAFQGAPLYHVPTGRTWSAPNSLMRRHRLNGIHCGTLVYRKAAWAATAGYPDLSFFEQTTFLERVLASGGTVVTVPNDRRYVQIRHGSNTWRDDVLGIPGWTPSDGMPWLPAEALDFYRSLAR